MKRFLMLLCLLVGIINSMPITALENISDDMYQNQIIRDGTPIYFYHQKLKTEEEVYFWKRFAGYSERSRGMQAIYYSILDQDTPNEGLLYNEEMYDWMRMQGVENPEQTLALARDYLVEHNIGREQLDRLLSGHRGGVAGFNPYVGGYIVFATKNPIDKPYALPEGSNPEAASFSNVLMVYTSFETSHGGIEHRGIIRNIHDLIRPDSRYKNLAILAHGFAADIEHTIYHRQFLVVKPLAFMMYLLVKAFPENYIYGDAVNTYSQNIVEHPEAYHEVFSLALEQMKSQPPLDLEELRHKSVEQDRIIFDLDAVAESFRKAKKIEKF